jgi:hypothetical protein
VNNVEENMSRILMTLSLIALIACNNQNSKDDLPEDKPDINKKEKTRFKPNRFAIRINTDFEY